MRKTIGYKQSLHYQNVISRYYVTTSEEMGRCLEDALETILKQIILYQTAFSIQ